MTAEQYPTRNTGPQAPDTPPPATVDLTLVDLLTRNLGRKLEDVARAITDAGYRAPVEVHRWENLTDYPPSSMLTDKTGHVWSADSIPRGLWDEWGPWHVVYAPRVTDVPNVNR